MRVLTLRNLSLIAAVLLIGAGVAAWRWYSKFTRFPVNRLPRWEMFEGWRISSTRQYLREATEAVAAFHAHYGKLPFNRPGHELQFSVTLGHDLSGIWPNTGRLNRDKIVFWNLPGSEQHDGWGNVLFYHFDHDGDGIVHPGVEPWRSVPGAKPVHRPFVIWSSGPNGRDDGGEGDDIRNW